MAGLDREVLIHNIGHHDFFLCVEDGGGGTQVLGVRGFSTGPVVQRLNEAVHRASGAMKRDPEQPALIRFDCPVGLGMTPEEQKRDLLGNHRTAPLLETPVVVVGLLFPLLCAAMKRWHSDWPVGAAAPANIAGGLAGMPERVVLLVACRPSDDALAGSDTGGVAELMRAYLQMPASGVVVGETESLVADPFSYEQVVAQVRGRTRKTIDAHRNEVLNSWKEPGREATDCWKEHFRLVLSVSTGSLPIMAALDSETRALRPRSIYVPGARRFPSIDRPHIAQMLEFQQVDAPIPAVSEDWIAGLRDNPDHWSARAVEAMLEWRRELDQNIDAVSSFWHRKGNKVVLATLVVEHCGEIAAIRSMNVEVSLPTGSLCAERNAIGTALSRFPALSREEIKAVAVMSLPDSGGAHLNPLAPCGACMEWLRKIAEVNPDFRIVMFDDADGERAHEVEVI